MTRMCCVCSKVEQGGSWRPLHQLSADRQVTHGYCPECYAVTMAEIEEFISEKAVGQFGAVGWSPLNSPGGPCV